MSAAIDLDGAVAVVTGVSGRLGAVWVDALLGAGATVVGIDVTDRSNPTLQAVIGNHKPERFAMFIADITDPGSLRRALVDCLDLVGPPTVLVNNAGVDQPPSADGTSWHFGEIPDDESARVLAVNAHGTLRMCQVFGSEMARRDGGSIINIGSLYGSLAPDPRLYEHLPVEPKFLKPPAYGMSKAGVASLTRYLAVLWGPAGVRVNTLSPGGVLGDQDPVFREKFDARVPLRRMARTPDLVGPLLFLASDLSRYVTGIELAVDGGYGCW